MSGIAGIFNLNGAEVDRKLLSGMLSAIAHRGMDCEGIFYDGPMAMGERLLSIDGEYPSNLPAFINNGALTIIYDGQIYNTAELRLDLEEEGYNFFSNAADELILHSYRKWGYDCGNKFNGNWAFAVWDREKQQLFCCRDRIGSKPFNYFFNGEIFVFASEIKAILKHPAVPRRVNEEQAYNYLMWGIAKNPGTTFFRDIHQLEQAHHAIVDKNGLKTGRWWNFHVNTDTTGLSQKDTEDSMKHFRSLLQDAVKIRLQNNSVSAIALSGGLESSVITVLANESREMFSGGVLKTFSCCYENEPQDERYYIEQVLKVTGAEKNYVFPDANNLWDELPRIIRQHDEPSGVYSTFSRWCMLEKVKEAGIKVLFDGDGGDATLAGNPWYGIYFLELARKGIIHSLLKEITCSLKVVGAKYLGKCAGDVLAGLMLSHLNPASQLKIRSLLFRLRGRRTDRIISPDFDRRNAFICQCMLSRQYGLTSKGLNRFIAYWISQFTWHPDIIAAPFQVEICTPFLDYRLLEFAFLLPSGLKIKNGWTKWILRESMKGKLPEEVRLRRQKNAFASPLKSWLTANRENITKLFETQDRLTRQYINGQVIVRSLENLLANDRTSMELWRYINFELWLRMYYE